MQSNIKKKNNGNITKVCNLSPQLRTSEIPELGERHVLHAYSVNTDIPAGIAQ